MRSPPCIPCGRAPTLLALLAASAPHALGQGPDADWPRFPPPEAPAPAFLEIPRIDSYDLSLGEGFVLRTDDGDAELRIGGLIQAQWIWNGAERTPETEVELRKARLDLSGKFGETFRFHLQPDFAEERGTLDQAWVGAEFGDRFATLLFGRSTVPFGLEEVRNRVAMDFANFSILDQFNPQQELGVFLNGGGHDRLFEWNLAAYDGNDIDNPTGDDGVAARLALHPFAGSGDALEHLHLGVAATYGDANGSIAGELIRNAAGLPIMEYSSDAQLAGSRVRTGLELAWHRGPWFLQSEAHFMSQDMSTGGPAESVDFDGWYIECSRVLTGETNDYLPVRPRSPISTRKLSGAGAFSLALRYSELNSDTALSSSDFVIPGAYVENVRSLWVGLNWTLDEHVLLRNSFVHSFYSDDIVLDNQSVSGESAFIVQLQLSF